MRFGVAVFASLAVWAISADAAVVGDYVFVGKVRSYDRKTVTLLVGPRKTPVVVPRSSIPASYELDGGKEVRAHLTPEQFETWRVRLQSRSED